MHAFQHIVSGDSAFASVKQALSLGDPDLVNMSDDLSVGPLCDVDDPPAPDRAAFWRRVFGPQADEAERRLGLSFGADLTAISNALKALSTETRPCLVWFGSGANEQLTLRRVAYSLARSAREIWAVEIIPADQKPLPPHWSTGVAVCRPDELAKIYERRRQLCSAERVVLAQEWQSACAESRENTLRHYSHRRVETRPIENYDNRIADACRTDWERTVRVVGDVMAGVEDAMLSDVIIFWRLRNMAKNGALEIDLPDAPMRESRVRRVQSVPDATTRHR